PGSVGSVLCNDVSRRLVVAGAAPFKIEPRGVAGPAKTGLGVADEFRPAHDAVDGQVELRWTSAAQRRAGGDEHQRRHGRCEKGRGNMHGKPRKRGGHYTIALNQTPALAVYLRVRTPRTLSSTLLRSLE